MWHHAVNKFIGEYQNCKDILAALLVGSYATGNNNKNSDIDICLISDDSLSWRERGIKYVDNVKIEYFINPPKQIYKYFENDLTDGSRCEATLFSNGIVLFDKSGITQVLKHKAEELLNTVNPKKSSFNIEMSKYYLIDGFEELETAYSEDSPKYNFIYNIYLDTCIDSVSALYGIPLPAQYKKFDFFTNPDFQKKYGLKYNYSNKEFDLVKQCYEEKDKTKSFELIKQLKHSIIEKSGGFIEDGWKIRTETEV